MASLGIRIVTQVATKAVAVGVPTALILKYKGAPVTPELHVRHDSVTTTESLTSDGSRLSVTKKSTNNLKVKL